jgi:hypothetical protein
MAQPRLLITVPPDVPRWLRRRRKHQGLTMSSQIICAVRAQMQSEKVKPVTRKMAEAS